MFNINGEYWRVLLVPPHHFGLLTSDGKFTLGACDDSDKIIYIANNLSNYKTEIVLCHEITHAAMFSYNIYLTLGQEELLANLIAHYGDEIIDIKDEVFSKINKGE